MNILSSKNAAANRAHERLMKRWMRAFLLATVAVLTGLIALLLYASDNYPNFSVFVAAAAVVILLGALYELVRRSRSSQPANQS